MFVSPTVVGNAVMIGSCAGTLYALDRTTGTPIWRYDTKSDGSAAQFHGEPLLIGDHVIKRKHTANAKRDLPGLIGEIIEPLTEQREAQARTFRTSPRE